MDQNSKNEEIAIAWFDLTMKVKPLLSRKEKVILSGLSGWASFGTLTAVMGPSGSGLTSLLKCLNGINNSLITESTQIRLNTNHKIRSAFIGHNEKEFLIMGLTAKQNMIYASKLKNSSVNEEVIDHESHVKQIMEDLLISDTMDTKAQNCSGGEQKRLAIGLELTALHKPNLILCDEPTTGLDSNVAEVVIACIKELAQKHNICIVTTIHQPNSDIMQTLDSLYVLAKGGQCVYSGSPQYLTRHLSQCNIICHAYQVPIEHLVTIGSKGCDDNDVRALISVTNKELRHSYDNSIHKTKLKRLEPKSKPFSLKDLSILLMRSVVIIRYYDWKRLLLNLVILCSITFVASDPFPTYMGRQNDCLSLSTPDPRSCFELLDSDNTVEQNISMLFIMSWFLQISLSIIGSSGLIPKYQTFRNEQQNKWYSSGAYFLSQNMIDFIPTTLYAMSGITIPFFRTHQNNEAKRYWSLIFVQILSLHLIDSLVYITTIVIPNSQLSTVAVFTFTVMGFLFGGYCILPEDLPGLMKFISSLSSLKFVVFPQIISTYGFDRCPQNMTSRTLFEYGIDDNDVYFEYIGYISLQIIIWRILAFIALIFFTNPKFYNFIKVFIKKLIPKKSSDNEITQNYELQCYDNSLAIDINGQSLNSDERQDTDESPITEIDSQSSYYTISEKNSDVNGREDNEYELSIGWVDLTLKVEKTFYSKEKLILREIKGFVHFGSLTALMGPSGAGKTSLLRSLNGMYKTLMTKESKIYLSNCRKIRTCFIAQDQREHIVNGLSVYQTLLYASKLKNVGQSVDHKLIIEKLMTELAINDIKDRTVHKCSAGQQKRIVMAMELTATVKPNLICVDEPTSGVDSYSALLMIKCFKKISEEHRLSIITSIHQPNLELLMLFDMLYVLAKGGVTVFSGRPQRLRRHLNECQIDLNENQIPIEELMKIAAKGYNDQKVIQLSEKTNEILRQYEERLNKELVHFPDGIPIRTKKFSLEELYPLFIRTMICILKYNWVIILSSYMCILMLGPLILLIFKNIDLESFNGCLDLNIDTNHTEGCLRTEQDLFQLRVLKYNFMYLFLVIIFPCFFVILCYTLQFGSDLKIFYSETKNQWYSCESFVLVKTVIDFVPLIPTILIFILIMNNYDKDYMFMQIATGMLLEMSALIGIAYLICIIFKSYSILAILAIIVLAVIYLDTIIPVREYSWFVQNIGNILPFVFSIKYLFSWYFSGFCSDQQISIILYKYRIDPNDDQTKSIVIMILDAILYRVVAYLVLKLRINFDVIMSKFKQLIRD